MADLPTLSGAPYDASSSYLRGPSQAPARIRQALQSPSSNLSTESGRSLAETDWWRDAGDLDVLDPAFAPGVSHWETGGLTTRELLTMLQAIDAPIVGADLVEYNPLRDATGMTAMVAAKVCKELLDAMAR